MGKRSLPVSGSVLRFVGAMGKRSLPVSVALVVNTAAAADPPAPPPPPTPSTSSTAAPTPPPPQEPRPLEITVQGVRPGTRGTSVEKIDRKNLDRLGVTTVAEAVERTPSVTTAFGSRGERIITLRGFDQRQLLVTLDSVPVQVPYDGQLDLGKIPLGLVDHVTLIKGAGSLLYGPNGLGGAVNIATRRPGEGPALMLATETAPFWAQRLSASATGKAGPVGALVGAAFENQLYFPMSEDFSGTYNQASGHRTNSDRRNVTAAGKLRWEIDDSNELVASVWRLGGQFGVPPGIYDLTPRYWRWSDWHVNTYALAHGYRKGRFTLDETVYYSDVGNTLDSYDSSSYKTQLLPVSFTSTFADRTIGGNARAAWQFACAQKRCVAVRGWVGAKNDRHESQSRVGAAWEKVDSSTLTAAGQMDGPLTRYLRWLAGAQVDTEIPGRSSSGIKPDSAVAVGPMGAVTVQPVVPLEITAAVAERTRFPTLKERFSTALGNQEPNPGLSAEHATNMSLDASYRPVKQVRIEAGVFDSEVRDVVTRVVIRPQTLQLQNAGRARFYGVEASVRARPWSWLELWGGWTAMKAHLVDSPNDRMAYRPEQKGIAAITVIPLPQVAVTFVARYVGSQHFQNPDTALWGTLGAMQLFDARLDVLPIQGLRLWIRSTNLTDAFVQGRYSYPEPGRQVLFGASVAWPDTGDLRANPSPL